MQNNLNNNFSIGIDAVEISRFENWYNYSKKKLLRIFTQQEINYCLENKIKSAERFAVRFAAKEAFFKAISSYVNQEISIFSLCKNIEIIKNKNIPKLDINYMYFKDSNIEKLQTKLSLTHTKEIAIAFVVII